MCLGDGGNSENSGWAISPIMMASLVMLLLRYAPDEVRREVRALAGGNGSLAAAERRDEAKPASKVLAELHWWQSRLECPCQADNPRGNATSTLKAPFWARHVLAYIVPPVQGLAARAQAWLQVIDERLFSVAEWRKHGKPVRL